MFVFLSSSQQLLDILGDLLCFADDVLSAGQRGVCLHHHIVQLRDGAALPQPAPQPASPAVPRIIHLRVIECVVIVTFRHADLLL